MSEFRLIIHEWHDPRSKLKQRGGLIIAIADGSDGFRLVGPSAAGLDCKLMFDKTFDADDVREIARRANAALEEK